MSKPIEPGCTCMIIGCARSDPDVPYKVGDIITVGNIAEWVGLCTNHGDPYWDIEGDAIWVISTCSLKRIDDNDLIQDEIKKKEKRPQHE